MLAQEYRLKKKKDFEITLEQGKFMGGALSTMKYWKVTPEQFLRRAYSVQDLKIAFVVSMKVSKKAVVRNRLKRQMRESVRLLMKEKIFSRGYFIIFFAKKEMIDQPFELISHDIQTLLRRARLI